MHVVLCSYCLPVPRDAKAIRNTSMTNSALNAFATAAILLPGMAAGAEYHLNSSTGNDANPGTSPKAAWKSLERVNQTVFQPGDRILLSAGGTWRGRLSPRGSGRKDAPIVISRYGDGPKPQIDGGGEQAAILLNNQEHWIIEGLELTNTSVSPMAKGHVFHKHAAEGRPETEVPGLRSGIVVLTSGQSRMAGLRITDCDIHDVKGSSWRLAKPGMYDNAGIYVRSDAPFDDVVIEGNHLHDLGTIGMIVWVGTGKNANNWGSADPALWGRGLRVRNNRIIKTGADGVIIGCSDGAVIEANTCYDVGVNAAPQPVCSGNPKDDVMHIAGVWCIASKDAVFQYNECARVRVFEHPADSQPWDVDMHCRGTITYQYNYSHDNPGGTLMIMNANPRLENVVFRYNISQNDGFQNKFNGSIAIFEPRKAELYNNVFVVTKGNNGYRLSDQPGSLYRNNIFAFASYTVGPQEYQPRTYPKQPVFEGNCYAGHDPLVADARKIVADPRFTASGTGGDGMGTTTGYILQKGSPCLGAGVVIPDPGNNDFFRNKLAKQGAPTVGAHQASP
jgi:hypothetical protein